MRIPEKIRIGSMLYTVTQSDKTLIVDSRECKGSIDYEHHRISINNVVQDVQGCEQTFLHEIVHGIVDSRAISLDNTDTELVVDELAMGLHQLILDNPEIFNNAE